MTSPVVLATSSEPTFPSKIPPSDGGLLTPTDNTNIPIIVGAVGGGMILIFIIITLIVVVVLVRCYSHNKVTFDPDAELKTTQPNGACELIKTDLEKGESFSVTKQTEVEKNGSNIKQKSSAQKDGSEETKIDLTKGNGTKNAKSKKPDKLKPAQRKVACVDSEIATEKGKLADRNTTTITIAAAKTTTKTTTKATTTTTTTKAAKTTTTTTKTTTTTTKATKYSQNILKIVSSSDPTLS